MSLQTQYKKVLSSMQPRQVAMLLQVLSDPEGNGLLWKQLKPEVMCKIAFGFDGK